MIRGGGSRASEWALALVSVAAGLLFFTSLGTLWPLADTQLSGSRDDMRRRARAHLETLGFDLEGYRAANRVSVATESLD